MIREDLKRRVFDLIAEWDDPEVYPTDVARRLRISRKKAEDAMRELHREKRLACEGGACDWCATEKPRPNGSMGLDRMLADLRSRGWSVAVHHDYRRDGRPFTFWLFTHPSGAFVKGEGPTDRRAVAIARASTEQDPVKNRTMVME